jgi:hypothetical protein
MSGQENKYTPETFHNKDIKFIIPLYQRLFEWEEAQVLQLLNDLYSSFQKNPDNSYYIGMLTTFRSNTDSQYSLVDGQQRFTVLTLIGIVLAWNKFLMEDGNLRLSFFARKKDEEYLNCLINNIPCAYENRKMKWAIDCIRKFFRDKHDKEFEKFVYTKTTFFIAELPEAYSLQDLNRYFETMNEAGKGLENYEILKVELLSKANQDNYNTYTTLWNEICEMDQRIIKQKENELQVDYQKRCLNNFKESSFKKVFNKDVIEQEKGNFMSLMTIEASNKNPSEIVLQRTERAILTFSDFLLQVLWISLEKENRNKATDFFNRYKLLETFKNHIKEYKNNGSVEVASFFDNLLKFRILFDYYIIRLNSSDERNVTYSLDQVAEDSDYESKRSLMQYQSMLYVSTESHIWLTPFLEELDAKKELSIESALAFLKNWDNKRWGNQNVSLTYGAINRYWFWRLDYYLWLKRAKYFDGKTKEIADKYLFRSNRSIEHIEPQNPKTESTTEISEELRDSFGNLAMISSGQNSSLQNSSFEMKKVYVQSFINESVGGSIQSLKMLNIYQFDKWSEDNLKIHNDKMIDILKESFDNYSEIVINLEKQKLNSETQNEFSK